MLTPKNKIIERLTRFVDKYWVLPNEYFEKLPALLEEEESEGSLYIPICISFANGCGTFSCVDLHWMWLNNDTDCINIIFSILAPSAAIAIDHDHTLNLSNIQITIEEKEKIHSYNSDNNDNTNNQEDTRLFAKIESIILTKRNSPTASIDQFHTLLQCDHFTISGFIEPNITLITNDATSNIIHVVKIDCALVVVKGSVNIKDNLPRKILESILTPYACTREIRVRSFRMVKFKPTLRDFDSLPVFTGDDKANLYNVICHLLEYLPEPRRRLSIPFFVLRFSL